MEKDTKQEAVKKHFDNYFLAWDKLYNGHPIEKYITHTRLEHVFNTIKDINFQQTDKLDIIEFGCGTGVLLSLTEQYFYNSEIVGVDISEQMLSIAKQKCKRSLIVHDSVDTYESTKKFDLIILVGVTEYLPSWENTLAKLKKILKPSGKIVLTFANASSYTTIFDKFYRKYFQKTKDTSFIRRYASIVQTKKQGKLNGLKVDKSTQYSFDMFTMKYIIGDRKKLIILYEKFIYKMDKWFANKKIGLAFSRAFIIQFSLDTN